MSCERRPYGLTEDDHLKLSRTRNVLRLFQHLGEESCTPGALVQVDPDQLNDFFCLIADQLDGVLHSVEAGEPTPVGRARG